MATATETTTGRATVLAVGATYGLQGLGYAVVVTALPAFQARTGLGATGISLILLGVCITAALGSLLADVVATRMSSRHGVMIGLSAQAVGLCAITFAPTTAVLAVAVLGYGLGLGMIDASSNMQGVLVQRGRGRPLLGRFYATATAGSIIGAVVMAAVLASGAIAFSTLLIAAALDAVFVVVFARHLSAARAARAAGGQVRAAARLDARAITIVGLVILGAFTVDAAASSWSSVHLTAVGAAAAIAPVGFATYQAGVLVARLLIDLVTARIGRRALLAAAICLGVLGGVVIAAVATPLGAIAGFAISGLAVGAMVPIAFSLAGAIDPSRSDEIIARVNLFNYGGAVLGAVAVGLLTDLVGSQLAFLLPALLLLAAVPAWRAAGR